MADQHNSDIPALTNQIANDVPDIKENLEFHKDAFQAICSGWSDTSVAALRVKGQEGFQSRARFRWKDTDEIYIGAGAYYHEGTSTQVVYWDSELTFALSGVGTSEMQYIYIDDSAVVTAGTPLLTATEFTHNTTAPTYSAAKHGWYHGTNTEDMCIFAVYIDGSGNVVEFYHMGEWVHYADQIAAAENSVDPDTTFSDVTLIIPGFATIAQISITQSSAINALWRTNGQTGSTGHYLGNGTSSCIVQADSSGIIEIKHSASGAQTTDVYTDGWAFGSGI